MLCIHKHGDFVAGIWICGQCWRKLEERPRKYVMAKALDYTDGDGESGNDFRQQVIPAPIIHADSGLTLSEFINSLAIRLMAKAVFTSKHDAVQYALDIMQTYDEEFASKDSDWTAIGAWDLVQEDMQHWDHDEADGNE